MSRRILKINELISQELAKMFLGYFSNEFGLITITDVSTSDDMKKSRVFISVLPQNEENEKMLLAKLKKYSYDFQEELGKVMQTHYTPKLEFSIDKSTEGIIRVEEILNNLDNNKN